MYRVHDAKGLYPKFYIATRHTLDNFILCPVTLYD